MMKKWVNISIWIAYGGVTLQSFISKAIKDAAVTNSLADLYFFLINVFLLNVYFWTQLRLSEDMYRYHRMEFWNHFTKKLFLDLITTFSLVLVSTLWLTLTYKYFCDNQFDI